MNDLRLYVLMRNDLQSMVPGRCMAQANHAASALEKECGRHKNVQAWKKQTPQGFGTCIVLSATKKEIDSILNQISSGLQSWIVDPDYCVRVTHEVAAFMKGVKFVPESADENTIAFTRSEKTCAYILGTKEELEQYLGDLPLY